MGALLQIGDVANETGLSIDTIRFYERERLLQRAARSNGGFRLFSNDDVADLTFIRNAQELGFSLQEIRDLVGLRKTRHPDCAQVEKMLDHKIASVRAKIAALRKLERELRRTMNHCKANLRKEAKTEDCPALAENLAKQRKTEEMTVELLYLPGCASHRATVDLVQSVLRAENMPAEYQEIAIRDHVEAAAHAFPGSPTIRVNGQDIENVSALQLSVGFACRTYVVDGRAQGVPPRSWLEEAIRSARNQEAYR